MVDNNTVLAWPEQMKMENRDAFVTTRSFCLAFLGIAVSLTIFGECTVSSSKTTTTQDVVTLPPKRCSFNNIDYNVGQSWNPFLLPAGYWRCIRCSCKLTSDGSTATIDCKSCRGTANEQHPEEGQRICIYKGKIRKHGAVWAETISDPLRNDQCTECSCTDRFVSCAVRTCPALSCKGKVKGSKTCCPVCKGDSQATRDARDCFTMGRSYRHLENWFHFGPPLYDLCIICSCKNSSVGCRKVVCPTPPCDNPERKPGACCNTCPVPVSNSGKLQRNNGSTSETVQTKNVSDECERAGVKFPHNTTFNPTIGPFGVSFCVTCLCNRSIIQCKGQRCPTNYSCENPVTVPGKCCKVCEGGDSKGPANGRRHCTTGKYWRVYEYTRRGNQSLTSHYIRVQFALVSRESGVVEIHTISASATAKTVKITNTTVENFDQVMKRNDHYKSIGKIRDAQRNKMRHNEMRPCHVTQGCVHTVKKIMERFWYRVGQCKMGISGLPGKLPIMPEKETPSDEE